MNPCRAGLQLLLVLLGLANGCEPAPVIAPQKVIVQAELDREGRVAKLSVVEGDRRLREAALGAAAGVHYEKDCDHDGRPVPSSIRVVVWFGRDGKPFKTEGGYVIRVGSVSQKGKLRRRVNPEYPPALKRAGIQGLVLIKVSVDKAGNPTALEPVRGHPQLIPLALAAVQKWKWTPTYVGCEPIPVVVTATVNFVAR